MSSIRRLGVPGCALAYRVQGEGPPVLFIQGTGLHGDGWGPQVEELCSSYRCLTFDNRGVAGSLPNGEPITVARMAQDALALLDAQGWDAAHVVGHSLGGLVALELARAARSRVRSLALLCTFARGADAVSMSLAKVVFGLGSFVGTRAMRRRAFTRFVLPPNRQSPEERDAWAARLEPIFGHDLADSPPVVMKQMAAMRAYDASPYLPRLAGLPTLVLGGRFDLIATQPVVTALAQAIPGARLMIMEGAAHGLTVQLAASVNAILAEHWG